MEHRHFCLCVLVSSMAAGLILMPKARRSRLGWTFRSLPWRRQRAFLELLQRLRIVEVQIRGLKLHLVFRLVEKLSNRRSIDTAMAAMLGEDHHDHLRALQCGE